MKSVFRALKALMPRRLYARTLMILVTPVVLAQLVTAFVFFDRHWSTMTNRLSYALAGDVGLVAELVAVDPRPQRLQRLAERVERHMDLKLTYRAGMQLPSEPAPPAFSLLRQRLQIALDDRLEQPYRLRMQAGPEQIGIDVQLQDGVLTVVSPERRIYTPTTMIFISWMLGSSIVLSVIALLFMRNQIRPIRRLARAAAAFGRGRDVPGFKPEGAAEVRQAAKALLMMRDRLRRQITQRTIMLAGISHDMRTPLTRMKLQLALLPDTAEHRELAADVAELAAMLEAYLAFARGESDEQVQALDIAALLREVLQQSQRPDIAITFNLPATSPQIRGRLQALKRCFGNIINNAMRYATQLVIELKLLEGRLLIQIDDNGAGIPPERREEVFRPFVRLDQARGGAGGNVGLGLTIARDIARLHGGDIRLDTSPLVGLRVMIFLPQ
jgi:two-component system, OmpR family, osmolarity sensor histidine kinase EnvZ